MNTEPDTNRSSLERIKILKTFALFKFDPPTSKASQSVRLSLFMASLHSMAISKGIDDGWDILPDFEENIIDDERVTHYGLIASGWRWETDKEYKERLETNLFYKKKSYETWLSQMSQFCTATSEPTPYSVEVMALEKKIAEIGK